MPLASGTKISYTLASGPTNKAIPTGTPAPVPSDNVASAVDQLTLDLMKLFTTDPLQKRPKRNANAILMKVAQARAEYCRNNNLVAHKDLAGHYVNYYILQAGYKLPSWYGKDENNCESLGAGQSTAAEIWQGWKDHLAHRVHVLGEDKFWADQVDFGIGHAVGGNYGHYWALVTART